MRLGIDVHLDYAFDAPADVLFQVEVAATHEQRLIEQALTLYTDHPVRAVAGGEGVGQRCWARATDRLVADYHCEVDIARAPVALADLPPTPVRDTPAEVVPYLLPSLYCPSATFEHFVRDTFPDHQGGALAAVIVEWVHANLRYAATGSSGETTALETFATRRGVCRDYAHLVVSLARAAEIPARCVSAYGPGVDPPDFHAVAELWLDGAWRLVDATGMAHAEELAIVAVGRDACDIAFMTIFGEARLQRQEVRVRRL